jgi:hypothetical protein
MVEQERVANLLVGRLDRPGTWATSSCSPTRSGETMLACTRTRAPGRALVPAHLVDHSRAGIGGITEVTNR